MLVCHCGSQDPCAAQECSSPDGEKFPCETPGASQGCSSTVGVKNGPHTGIFRSCLVQTRFCMFTQLSSAAACGPASLRFVNGVRTRLERTSPSAHSLPASLLYSRDLALVSELTEADTADAVFSQICMRTAADSAAVIFSCGELCRTLLFDLH